MIVKKERMTDRMNRRKGRIAGVILAVAVMSGMCAGCGTDGAQVQGEAGAAAESEAAEDRQPDLPAAGGAAPDGETEELSGTEDDLEDILSDPTLGGIFQLYTVEEYEEVVENVKKYADGGSVSNMEADLEKLKADNGKGEFVLYKSAFEESYEEDGYQVATGFNPMIVMNPWQEYENAGLELTAEAYRKEMEAVTNTLDDAIADGQLTPEKKEIILGKMYDNLKKMK